MKRTPREQDGQEKEEKESHKQEEVKRARQETRKDNDTPSSKAPHSNLGSAKSFVQAKAHGKEGIIHLHRHFLENGLPHASASNFDYTKLKDKPDNLPRSFLSHAGLSGIQNLKSTNDPLYNLLLSQNKTSIGTSSASSAARKSLLNNAPIVRPKPVVPVVRQSSNQTNVIANMSTRASLLSSVGSDDRNNDVRQGFTVPQLTHCDSLLIPNSPVPSPLFSDNTTVFPFSNTDFIIEQDAGFTDIPYVGSQAFANIQLDKQSARTESIQNLMQSSPRHSAARMSGTSAFTQPTLRNGNSHTALSEQLSVINCGAKKRVVVSSDVPHVSGADKNISMTATSNSALESFKGPKVSKNGVNLLKSVHGKGPVSIRKVGFTGLERENPLKRTRSDSSGFTSTETKDPFSLIQPPPHGEIKRAGPYLLGKLNC